ncbi:MAG: hypothetical protein H5T62_15170 [Anaerolineae bacterium]|nr:hypothetical protein [Anaerolineae bacterium]
MKTQRPWLRSVALLLLSVSAIVLGLLLDQWMITWVNATLLCLSCIGIQ